MSEPDPAVAPVIPPVMVPVVQLKFTEAVAVSEMFVVLPLQMLDVDGVVIAGFASTFNVMVKG